MTWSNAELIESYLIYGAEIPGLMHFPDRKVERLKAMTINYQKGVEEVDNVVEAAFNHHSHTKSCFCKAAKPRKNAGELKWKHISADDYVCRYCLPRKKRRRTNINDLTASTVKWFWWTSEHSKRIIKEVNVQRHQYDAFQNVSCTAISSSRLACNSNIAAIMPGPVGLYMFKYQMKGTQDDDTEEYDCILHAT